MQSLLKILIVLAVLLGSPFVLLNLTGVVSAEGIMAVLESTIGAASGQERLLVALIICLLICVDLFVSVPTLLIVLFAGYTLGAVFGAMVASAGLLLVGVGGYALGCRYGHFIVNRIITDKHKRQEAMQLFCKHGSVAIILSRSVPLLPEVSACMAGITGMNFGRFLLCWLLSTVPYAAILASAGALSTPENPQPAIFTAMAICAALWLGWFVFGKYRA